MTDTTTEHLFDLDPAVRDDDGHARTPVTELRAMHLRGVKLLEHLARGRAAVFRVRDASTRAWDDAERRHQVTIRRKTAKGADAAEWDRLASGQAEVLVYGWLRGDTVEAALVLDGTYLVEDVVDRPGCLVPPATGPGVLHHAPDGAEFLVVDVRRVRPEVVLHGEGQIEWATLPADLAAQGELF